MPNFLALIGFLLPPLIDLINNKVGNSYAKFWISVLVCVMVGVVVEWISGGLFVYEGGPINFEGISEQILMIFGVAQLVYKGLWEGSKADDQLKTLQK